jgi:hypothetical protein
LREIGEFFPVGLIDEIWTPNPSLWVVPHRITIQQDSCTMERAYFGERHCWKTLGHCDGAVLLHTIFRAIDLTRLLFALLFKIT